MEDFGGDVLLADSLDGAELVIQNGLIMDDKGLKNAVYLSILGGNSDDAGEGMANKTWWGNLIPGQAENEKLISRFQAFIRSEPLTSKNLQVAEEKIKQDLQWLIDAGYVDEIVVDIRATGLKCIIVKIDLLKQEALLDSGSYSVLWENIKNGI